MYAAPGAQPLIYAHHQQLASSGGNRGSQIGQQPTLAQLQQQQQPLQAMQAQPAAGASLDQKVEQLMQMGFDDREKVLRVLSWNNGDVERALNQLLGD